MEQGAQVLRGFYQAVVRRDFVEARRFLADDLVFTGLFETYSSPEAYLAALTGLMGIVTRLDLRAVIEDGNEVAVFFELETTAPAEATTLVAEWHRLRNGRIHRVASAFDGRRFAAMFLGDGGPDTAAGNRAVVRQFTRVFKNEHNVDSIDHLFAPRFEHHFGPTVRPGVEGLKDVGRMMNTAFPDVVVTEEDLVATSDTVVERSSARATHRGEFMGVAATGREIDWTEIHIYRLAQGRITGHWAEISLYQLVAQIAKVA